MPKPFRSQLQLLSDRWHQQVFCDPHSRAFTDFGEMITKTPISAKKVGMMIVYATSRGALRPISRRAAERPYRKAGHTVLGNGFNFTVIASGTREVLKIHRASARMTEDERRRLVVHLERQQMLVTTHLGPYAVSQALTIEPHPLRPSVRVVTARQPRVEDFQPISSDIVRRQVMPQAQLEQLGDFCTRAAGMITATEHGPDIYGEGNLGFDGTGRLLLIDPDPLPVGPDTSLAGRATLEELRLLHSHSLAGMTVS